MICLKYMFLDEIKQIQTIQILKDKLLLRVKLCKGFNEEQCNDIITPQKYPQMIPILFCSFKLNDLEIIKQSLRISVLQTATPLFVGLSVQL